MTRVRMMAGLAIAALLGVAQADEIRLSPDEIENLGIRFVRPAPAADAAGLEVTARVVLPPAGDAIVSAPQTGLLTRLQANIGDQVVEGDILAELRSPEFVSLQREFLDAFNGRRLAQQEYERDAQLHEEGIISARRLQETTARKAVADAAVDEHRQLLRFAGMRDADIRSLAREQRLRESLPIRAPFDGVIAERLGSTGERLEAMSPIYRIVDMSELWLDISVPQERLVLVRQGATVAATGSAGTYAAILTSVGRAIDPTTQSAIVRARLEAGADGFRPGQFVSVRVSTSDPNAAATEIHEVPAAAVMRSGKASYVFIRTNNGVTATAVEFLGANGDRAWVTGSLGADDTVAASGITALKSLWAAGSAEDS